MRLFQNLSFAGSPLFLKKNKKDQKKREIRLTEQKRSDILYTRSCSKTSVFGTSSYTAAVRMAGAGLPVEQAGDCMFFYTFRPNLRQNR
jgi:hypothetical protein